MKKRRVFFHFNRANMGMTVHFNKQCISVKDVECNVKCETKWNTKQQPFLVMQGWAKTVEIVDNKAIIK